MTLFLPPVITMTSLLRFLKSEDGPTTVEYAVMLALIVITVAASVGRLARSTGDLYDRNSNALTAAGF